MTTALHTLDDTLVQATRVARRRIRATRFYADAIEGRMTMESYATLVRVLSALVHQSEGALARSSHLSAFARTGLSRRHALARDHVVVSGFARVFPVAGTVWRKRLERFEAQPAMIVAHLALFHLSSPLGDDPVVDGLEQSTGLRRGRGLEGLSVGGRAQPSAFARWRDAARSLAADAHLRRSLIAEANVATALLEQVLVEIHGPAAR
jgi:hypothetical protein